MTTFSCCTMVAAPASSTGTTSSPPRHRIAPPRGGLRGVGGGRSGIPVTRPPILLELSERYIKVGQVGQATSNQLIVLPPRPARPPPATTTCGAAVVRLPSSAQVTAEEWYRYYAPLFQDALSFVQDVSLPNKRRIVVIHHGAPSPQGGLYPAQQHALERILLHALQSPAVAFVSAAPLAAFSVVGGGVVAPRHVLVVYRCPSREWHCLVVSHGRTLDYTYRATGQRSSGLPLPDNGGGSGGPPDTLQQDEEQSAQDGLWDLTSPHSLARCVVTCLAACPRDIRKDVASSLLLAGDVWDGRRVARQLVRQIRTLLQQMPVPPSKATESRGSVAAVDDPAEDPALTPPTTISTAASPVVVLYTHTPLNPELRALASLVAVVQIPHVRPDALPWLGASVWASHWHAVQPSLSSPSSSSEMIVGGIPWVTSDDAR